MSDFLVRLGAQAMGAAPVIKPRRPARFEPIDGPVGDIPDDAQLDAEDQTTVRAVNVEPEPGDLARAETQIDDRTGSRAAGDQRRPPEMAANSYRAVRNVAAAAPPQASRFDLPTGPIVDPTDARRSPEMHAAPVRSGPLTAPPGSLEPATAPPAAAVLAPSHEGRRPHSLDTVSGDPSPDLEPPAVARGPWRLAITSVDLSSQSERSTGNIRLRPAQPGEPSTVPRAPARPASATTVVAAPTERRDPVATERVPEHRSMMPRGTPDESVLPSNPAVEFPDGASPEPVAPIVEVHIGRLDVFANPVQPRAPRGRARALPTLAEYLANSRKR